MQLSHLECVAFKHQAAQFAGLQAASAGDGAAIRPCFEPCRSNTTSDTNDEGKAHVDLRQQRLLVPYVTEFDFYCPRPGKWGYADHNFLEPL